MGQRNNNSAGFTLIAALLILVLLSGVAAGLIYLVTNESRMSGNDLETNLAYYGAESGMEKLTADVSALYTQYMIPTNAQIQNLTNFPPTPAMVSGMNYTETITYPTDANGNPVSSWNTVSSGSNQGLYAEIIPMTMQVIASRPGGASVNMTRKVEVSLIPVFQFGVFCGYDCSYFPGPNFSFGGRVHTNGSLFLAAGGDLVFNDKVAAYQQVIMDQLENGHLTTTGYGGTVFVPKASAGCPLNTFPPTGTNCVALPGAGTIPGDASWSGGFPSIAGAANPNFPSLSSGTLNGLRGQFADRRHQYAVAVCAEQLHQQSSALHRSDCNYSQAAAGRVGDERARDVRVCTTKRRFESCWPTRWLTCIRSVDWARSTRTTCNSSPTPVGTYPAAAGARDTSGASVSGLEFYGMAQTAPSINNWVNPVGYPGWTAYPLLGELTTAGIPNNGQGAWLRVEYLNNTGNWVGITRKWLNWSFTRQYNLPPTGPTGTAGADPYNPNAILILQQMNPDDPFPDRTIPMRFTRSISTTRAKAKCATPTTDAPSTAS